jgi:hypothetical protein
MRNIHPMPAMKGFICLDRDPHFTFMNGTFPGSTDTDGKEKAVMATSIPDSWFAIKKLRARLMDPSGRRVDRIIQIRVNPISGRTSRITFSRANEKRRALIVCLPRHRMPGKQRTAHFAVPR